MQRPLCLLGILPLKALATQQRTALAITLYLICRLSLFFVRKITELIVVEVEPIIALIRLAQDLSARQQADIANTVCTHVAAIAHRRLKRPEFIAVISAQTVPCGKPHKAELVL